MTKYSTRLVALLRRLGAAADAERLAEDVVSAWSSPGRHYHTVDHLCDCLAELDAAPPGSADPASRDRVEAAIWFHDAIYDARAGDNEIRSAAWARTALAALGISRSVADDVARLVLLTGHVGPAPDPAGQLLCDIDLAILGREPAVFDAYDRAIRAEYDWVPEPEFRTGRRRILAALLERRPIYSTPFFRARYEAAARRNLTAALARLDGA